MLVLIFIFMLFCLCGSTWISATEVAITSLSQVKVKKLIAQVTALSDILLNWLKSPSYLLSLILTINVIFDMTFSFCATYILTESLSFLPRHIVEFVTWILSSFLIIVIGELVPKLYARAHSEKISIISVRILSKIEKISKPILYPIIKLTEFISPKSSPNDQANELSKKEAQDMITEGDFAGELDEDTSAMLKKTLNFAELSVEKIMQPLSKLESVNVDLDEEVFLNHVIETSRSRIPVFKMRRKNIIGYIHIKDVLTAWEAGKENFAKRIIRQPYFIDSKKNISDLLKEFQSGKTHIAFVKTAGELIGFLTLEDILEEVVGEIVDEYELKK
jgi:CBS domain containing-hemolysin-like protein